MSEIFGVVNTCTKMRNVSSKPALRCWYFDFLGLVWGFSLWRAEHWHIGTIVDGSQAPTLYIFILINNFWCTLRSWKSMMRWKQSIIIAILTQIRLCSWWYHLQPHKLAKALHLYSCDIFSTYYLLLIIVREYRVELPENCRSHMKRTEHSFNSWCEFRLIWKKWIIRLVSDTLHRLHQNIIFNNR